MAGLEKAQAEIVRLKKKRKEKKLDEDTYLNNA